MSTISQIKMSRRLDVWSLRADRQTDISAHRNTSTGWPKNCTIFVRLNFNNFRYYSTTRIRRKFVIMLSLKIPPHITCVATLPCKMSSVLKATTENKTTSVSSITTRLKNNTREQRVYCLSYCLK